MIGVVVYALVAIGLAAAAGYAVMMFFDASQTTSLVQENQARLDTAVTVARANLRAVNQDGVLFPPQGETPSGEDMLGLPAWFSVLRSSPWNATFNYCPFGPGGTYDAGGTVAMVATGDAPDILAVTAGAGGVFEVSGDRRLQFPAGRTVRVIGSTGNDGNYAVSGSSYSPTPVDHTMVVVTGNIPNPTADGRIQAYYDVNTATAGGQTYVVADNLDIPGVDATTEAGLLGLIISAPPRSPKVPPCHNVVYQNGAFQVDGGTVRAITSGVAEAQQDFAAAGKVSKTVASVADLDSALNEWVAVKPRIMEISLAPGSYTIEANPGGVFSDSGTYAIAAVDAATNIFSVAGDLTTVFAAGRRFVVTGSTGNNGSYRVASSAYSAPNTAITVEEDFTSGTADGTIRFSEGDENEKLLVLKKGAGTGTVSITIQDLVAPNVSAPLTIPARLTLDNVALSIAPAVGANAYLNVRGRNVSLKNAAAPAMVVSNAALTVDGFCTVANAGTGNSALTISSGNLKVLDNSSLTITNAATASGVSALSLHGADAIIGAGAAVSATSTGTTSGHGIVISSSSFKLMDNAALTVVNAATSTPSTFPIINDPGQAGIYLDGGEFLASAGSVIDVRVPATQTPIVENAGEFAANTATIRLRQASGTMPQGILVRDRLLLRGSTVEFPNGTATTLITRGIVMGSGAIVTLDMNEADAQTYVGGSTAVQRPGIGVYDIGAAAIFGGIARLNGAGGTTAATIRVTSTGDCWDGTAPDNTSTTCVPSSQCTAVANLCTRNLFKYSQPGTTAGNLSEVIAPINANWSGAAATAAAQGRCLAGWMSVSAVNRSNWTCVRG